MNRRDLFKALAAVPVAMAVKPDAAGQGNDWKVVAGHGVWVGEGATRVYTHTDVLAEGFEYEVWTGGARCRFFTLIGPAPQIMDVVEVNLTDKDGPRFVGRVSEVRTQTGHYRGGFRYGITLEQHPQQRVSLHVDNREIARQVLDILPSEIRRQRL